MVLRATKFVGTIPLTRRISVRVIPRATVANLSHMLVRSGVIPSAVAGFARGYLPRFESANDVERMYGQSLVKGVDDVVRRGLMKGYIRAGNPPPWRGRLLVSDTVRRYASKGIRYRHEFDHQLLSLSTVENMSLKMALRQVEAWYREHASGKAMFNEVSLALRRLADVETWKGDVAHLVMKLGEGIHGLPSAYDYYREPLWTAYVVLQSVIPEMDQSGFVSLDSLIIDMSMVFESFVRRELAKRLRGQGYMVVDGNRNPGWLFEDRRKYRVQPDICIRDKKGIQGLLDVKYKKQPKEGDRYQVIAFMEAMDVKVGGFVVPSAGEGTTVTYLGTTKGGKRLYCFYYNLAAQDIDGEVDRLGSDVLEVMRDACGS